MPVVAVDVASDTGKVAMVVRADNAAYGEKARDYLGRQVGSGKVVQIMGDLASVNGALTGVLLLGVVRNLLTLAQVPSFWIQAIYGGIILVALMIARVTTGRAQG